MIELCIGLGIAVLILATATWRLSNANDELRTELARKFHDEMMAQIRHYTVSVKFLKVENVGDNHTFNRQVELWEQEGYTYKPDKSTETVLCFEKRIYDEDKMENYGKEERV